MTPTTMVSPRARLDHGRSAVAALVESSPGALVPLLAALAVALFAVAGPADDARAEGLYLARLLAGALAACAALAPRPELAASAATLVVAAAWVLPAGPPRAVVVTALLLASLTLAAILRWRRHREGEESPLALTVPLFLGAQFLLRSDLLLGTPSARGIVALLVLPTASAAATSVLARRHGPRAWIAAAAVLCLAPGSNVATTLALVALAAGSALAERGRPRWQIGLAIAGLAAPLGWDWRPGLIAALAGTMLAVAGANRRIALAAAATACAAAILLTALATSAPALVTAAPAWGTLAVLPLLVPSLVLAVLALRPAAIAAAALAVGAVASIDAPTALAAPAALACLVALGHQPSEPLARRWQLGWGSALLLLTAGFAVYPWLRSDALLAALGTMGLRASGLNDPRAWAPALILLLAVATRSRPLFSRAAPGVAAAGAALAVALHLGAPVRHLLQGEVVLSAERSQWPAEIEATPVPWKALTLESTLLNAAQLPRGAPAGEVVAVLADGSEQRFAVRAGEETAEWAARRGDLRAANLAPSPPAWLSWVAGATPPFFGQRYRARWTFASAVPVKSLTVVRDSGLPPAVSLVIYDLGAEQ